MDLRPSLVGWPGWQYYCSWLCVSRVLLREDCAGEQPVKLTSMVTWVLLIESDLCHLPILHWQWWGSPWQESLCSVIACWQGVPGCQCSDAVSAVITHEKSEDQICHKLLLECKKDLEILFLSSTRDKIISQFSSDAISACANYMQTTLLNASSELRMSE